MAVVSDGMTTVRQRPGGDSEAPWILDRHGRRMVGRDHGGRSEQLHAGLRRHPRVRELLSGATEQDVERVLARLHEDCYLDALRRVDWEEPRMTPEWAPPGLPADSPVWASIVTAAFEGVRTAIGAAQRLLEGDRFAYAVCRPPGHHAGPSWMGGYCYLNTAAAAAQTLREGGIGPVTILDLDFHFPTGTAAVVKRLDGVALHSLHATTLENVPWREMTESEHERFVDITGTPEADSYIAELEGSIAETAMAGGAIVLSLGYDTVGGDPHGSWSFPPPFFARVGATLAGSALQVCVVQEGGYAVDSLAECSHAFATGLLGEEGS
jgi:acetoin utilization deacetylase AcuC-like enzyme